MVKNPPATAGDIRDPGSIPGSGRSPGGGRGGLQSIGSQGVGHQHTRSSFSVEAGPEHTQDTHTSLFGKVVLAFPQYKQSPSLSLSLSLSVIISASFPHP